MGSREAKPGHQKTIQTQQSHMHYTSLSVRFESTFKKTGKNGYWLCDKEIQSSQTCKKWEEKKNKIKRNNKKPHICALQKNRPDHSWKGGKPFNQVLEIQAAGSQNILMDFKLFAFNNNFQVCKVFRSTLLVQLLQHFCRTEKTDIARVPIKNQLFSFFCLLSFFVLLN